MKGLSREVVLKISGEKGEPEWMRELRLEGLRLFEDMPELDYGPDLGGLDLGEIEMYVPSGSETAQTWGDVPAEMRRTFEELGIPEAEREGLAGVGAQWDSEIVYHRLKEQVGKTGVVYLPIDEAINDEKWGAVVREHFMKLVPPGDHKYAALHAAVHSGGTFLYVPKGVGVEIPLQSYYRMNAVSAGQFEHTLIVVDEDAELHYIEGCSAPKLSVANLHAGVVELYVGKGAKLKYSTVESWSKNVYNLNTKRAKVEDRGEIEWVTGSFGSKASMLYPCGVLEGEGAKMTYTGVTFAGAGQELDTGAKAIHIGRNTKSYMDMRGLAKDGGKVMSRSLVRVVSGAEGAKGYADCKTLILDEKSEAEAVPEIKVAEKTAEVAHEASVGRLAEEQLRYLEARGLDEEAARGLLVRGFTEDISKELPLEYAAEMNNLIKLEMKGAI